MMSPCRLLSREWSQEPYKWRVTWFRDCSCLLCRSQRHSCCLECQAAEVWRTALYKLFGVLCPRRTKWTEMGPDLLSLPWHVFYTSCLISTLRATWHHPNVSWPFQVPGPLSLLSTVPTSHVSSQHGVRFSLKSWGLPLLSSSWFCFFLLIRLGTLIFSSLPTITTSIHVKNSRFWLLGFEYGMYLVLYASY